MRYPFAPSMRLPYCTREVGNLDEGKWGSMRRSILLLALVLLLMLAVVPAASAHVHGITPLSCGPANANAGGNGTNGTPADDANGGPIAGLIPTTVGSGAIPGGGGSGATNGHCP